MQRVARTPSAPGSVEAQLAEMWGEILVSNGFPDTAIHLEDDVFALGATSLDTLLMAEQIAEHYGIAVADDQMFLRTTIASQAALVRKSLPTAPRVSRDFTNLRLLRRACGDKPSHGAVLGLPGIGGTAPYLGVVAAQTLQDFDI